MPDLRSLLAEFGANRSAVHLLDDDDPELLPYATLTAARRRAATRETWTMTKTADTKLISL